MQKAQWSEKGPGVTTSDPLELINISDHEPTTVCKSEWIVEHSVQDRTPEAGNANKVNKQTNKDMPEVCLTAPQPYCETVLWTDETKVQLLKVERASWFGPTLLPLGLDNLPSSRGKLNSQN